MTSISQDDIKKLIRKLQNENLRSSFLNAFPGKSYAKFDLGRLDDVEDSLSKDLIYDLLTKRTFSRKVHHPTPPIDYDQDKVVAINKRLQRLYLRGKDIEREKGLNVIYIGFPLLQRLQARSSDKRVLAPLLLWEVELQHSRNFSQWSIVRPKEGEVRVNNALDLFQRNMGEPTLPEIDEEVFEDSLVDKRELTAYLGKVSKLENINIDLDSFWSTLDQLGLERLPENRDDLYQERVTVPKYRILPSAVIGVFAASKEAIIEDLNGYLQTDTNIDIPENEVEAERFGGLPLDPSQLGALRTLPTPKNIVIHGPPGTGKSQVLTGIISSAIAKGKRVLVACEKVTALEVIQNNLDELGFQKQVALINDVKRDRTKIAKIARSLGEAGAMSYGFKTKSPSILDLEKKHALHVSAIQRPIYGSYNWTQIVGFYLKYSDGPNVNLPKNTIKNWSEKDPQIITEIKELSKIRGKVQQHGIVHKYIKNPAQAEPVKIKSQLDTLLNISDTYFRKKETCLNTVNNDLKGLVSKQLLSIEEKERSLANETKLLEDARVQWLSHPEKFRKIYQHGNGLFKYLYGLFSTSYRAVIPAYEAYTSAEKSLQQLVLKIGAHYDENELKKLESTLKNEHNRFLEFEKLLSNGENQIIQVATELSYEVTNWTKLNRKWEEELTELDSLDTNQIKKLTKDQIERIYALLTGVLTDMADYSRFFSLLDSLRIPYSITTMNSLFQVKDWAEGALKSLFQFLIEKEESKSILTQDTPLKKLDEKSQEYQFYVKRSMEKAAQGLLDSSIKSFTKYGDNIRSVFNLRGSKGKKRNPLKKICSKFPDAFAGMFPVILTTPINASILFSGKKEFFDLIIFDEASQINLEDAASCLIKGKSIVVAGDEHQMPPSNLFRGSMDDDDDDDSFTNIASSESLLDFAIGSKSFENNYLDFHYRSQHSRLIDFSNAAFYGRLIPIPNKIDYTPIEYVHANGTYTNQTNKKEAEKVISILEKLYDTHTGTPSIGIATLNIKQRNLVFEIIAEKSKTDKAFAAKMTDLENTGFFIKNLENIQGDERDFIIISTTFGLNEKNKFVQNFGPLNRDVGYRLLNVLITRAKKKVFVITSIPSRFTDEYKDLIATKGNLGRGIFYAYLQYARAVSNKDQKTINTVLNLLQEKNTHSLVHKQEGLLESPFEEEVYEALLRSGFSENEITIQEKDSGFRLDLVVRPNSTPGLKIAIECDGATYHSSYQSYHYDLHRQKILERAGYHFIRIWSKNWFLSSSKECVKLITEIKERMKRHGNQPQNLPSELRRLTKLWGAPSQTTNIDPTQEVQDDNELEENGSIQVLNKPEVSRLIQLGDQVTLHELTKDRRFTFVISERQGQLKEGYLYEDSPLARILYTAKEGDICELNGFKYKLLKTEKAK